VLVADDDQHILELVRFALEQEGCDVLAAGDGAEALQLAFEHLPQMCVLDAMMPNVDGFEAARRLAADERTSTIPVLLLTAKDRDEVAARGFSVGAAEYLQKPFSPAALQARVRAVLESE
jgi:DNA-binding response OmpR family regulator